MWVYILLAVLCGLICVFFAARWVSGRKSTAVDRTARSVEDTGVRGSVDVTQANLYAELAAKNELLSSQILKLTGDKALLEAEISTNTEVNRVLSEKISELKELECESLGIIEWAKETAEEGKEELDKVLLQIKKEERKLEIIVGELEKHYNDNWRKNNLHIDEDSRVAIRLLKEVSVQLPLIKGALRKVAYEVYYKRAVDELIKGVAGKCGIYRIVHIESGRIYVGQSVDIGERWKQHIKRVLGIEVSTMNKLYPWMEEYGVENFSFEIIEECEKGELRERENYWIEKYKSKVWGLNVA